MQAGSAVLFPRKLSAILFRMKWIEIAVYTTDAGIEPVLGALASIGLEQVAIEESRDRAMSFLNESALYWDYADADRIGTDTPCVKAYVSDLPENLPTIDAAREAIARIRGLDLPFDPGPLSVVISRSDEEDWLNNWKKYYKPIEIGEKLLVLPSWEPLPKGAEKRSILRLDPGVAFGTGGHHTTRMCLEVLEEKVQKGDRVLDLGCGSGILSIAALLLGADSALAIDIDPIAERIVSENGRENGMDSDRLRVRIGDILTNIPLREEASGQYDIVVANIVADVILRLTPYARQCCRPGGLFITSGIIDERLDEIRQGLLQNGFKIETVLSREGWNAVVANG